MSARDDKIRQVVAELDAHVAEVEASVAILKALLAGDEGSEEQQDPADPKTTPRQRRCVPTTEPTRVSDTNVSPRP
jgi:hypothetical protein